VMTTVTYPPVVELEVEQLAVEAVAVEEVTVSTPFVYPL